MNPETYMRARPRQSKERWIGSCVINEKFTVSIVTDSVCEMMDWVNEVTLEFSDKRMVISIQNVNRG